VNEGFAMSSFEWMELQTLTNDIDMSRSRLVEARKSGDQGRVGALEEEITRAEKRRLQLLAHISTNIVTAPEPSRAKPKEGAGSRQAADPVADAPQETTKNEPAAEAAPAPRSRAREGATSRQAAAPAAEALQAATEQSPGDTAGAIETASPPKAREGSGSRQASAVPAEEQSGIAEKPLGDTAGAPESAPPPKEKEGAGSREASAAAAEVVPDSATVDRGRGETAEAPEPAPSSKAKEGTASRQAPAPAAEASRDGGSREQPLPDRADRIDASGAVSPASALKADSVEGGTIVWEQLTPGDIARVKNELGERRAEMLARHAEELKGLEAEQSQLETLEQAIEMFLRKAKRPESAAA
jgi:ribonuclease E